MKFRSIVIGIVISLSVFVGIGHTEQAKPKPVVGKNINEALLGLRNEFSDKSQKQSQRASKREDSTLSRKHSEVSHD